MNDLISRQSVSAWLGHMGFSKLADIVMDKDRFPPTQYEPQWIPCSKRLPEEEEKSYWVCLDGGGQCQCRWTNNMYGLGTWDKWGWHVMDKPQYSRIIAWMPLPAAYREEEHE